MSMASLAIVWNFFEKQWIKNHPQYHSGLSRALFPTTFLEIAVYRRFRASATQAKRRAAREKVKLCTPLTRAFDLLWLKRKIRVYSQSKSSVVYPGFSGVAQMPAGGDSIPGGHSWENLLGTVPPGFPNGLTQFQTKKYFSFSTPIFRARLMCT